MPRHRHDPHQAWIPSPSTRKWCARTPRCWTLTPDGRGGLLQLQETDLLHAIEALGINRVRLITTGGDAFETERERWNDANNVLTIRPGGDRLSATSGPTELRQSGHHHRAAPSHGDEVGTRAARRALHELSRWNATEFKESHRWNENPLWLWPWAATRLLKRGGTAGSEIQRQNIELGRPHHRRTHGAVARGVGSRQRSMQVGLLALPETAPHDKVTPYPLDVLGAESRG